ncbi:MAG: PrsW family intramembrane metalloprotease, partial [Acidimicrobiia bacterium]
MAVFLIVVVVALVPALFYVLFIRLLDLFEKEPLWLVSIAFLWGAIPAVVIALIGELAGSLAYSTLVSADPNNVDAVSAAVLAPVIEELAKGAFLALLFVAFRRQIDSPLDGLVIGATVGFGFAASENVVYLLGAYSTDGTTALVVTAMLRIVVLGFG